MIINKACFDTVIGTLYYLWLDDDKKGPGIIALSTSQSWTGDYGSFLGKDPGVELRKNSLLILEKEISGYLAGENREFSLRPVFLSGTDFEKKVWEEASSVPFGCTCSYGDLAAMCGRPGAARAVGNAIGKNPVMFIVPCQRIIKGDGSIGGFGSGPGLKKKLLAIEGTVF